MTIVYYRKECKIYIEQLRGSRKENIRKQQRDENLGIKTSYFYELISDTFLKCSKGFAF
jgi:hypothetical protein